MVRFLVLALALCVGPAWSVHAADGRAPAAKVLRYAFPAAESGFDPAQVTDLYSNTVLAHIFE
ncbi:MAG TPA: bicyclomycin resistance protein, partial [Burkholderiaceae bacterium]|nr:bicyclomycin resistance protein [Burkholderiaceae bacterium]